MKNTSILIKPASGLCNMCCRYCFYEDEVQNRTVQSTGIMNETTADCLIERALAGQGRSNIVTFAFQGGEPTLAGKAYYCHFVQQVKQKNTDGAMVQYAIQTNGLVIDEEWAEIFRQNHFLVGISLDGNKVLHDANRIDASGKGTWTRVERSLRLLQRANVETNLLCVVTRDCARSPQKVYNSLKRLGAGYLQFIACLDPLGQPRGKMPYSLLPTDYGKFLCTLFDFWYLDWKQGHYTSVRLFDDFVHLAMGMPAGTCATSGSCGAYTVVEADGSVYPCDFYVLDEWKLGNIQDQTLEELVAHPLATRFLQEGLRRPTECAACRWRSLCGGGCKRDWIEQNGRTQNYYCTSFKMLFTHAESRIAEIARAEMQTPFWRQPR